jgi:hypothetical protein
VQAGDLICEIALAIEMGLAEVGAKRARRHVFASGSGDAAYPIRDRTAAGARQRALPSPAASRYHQRHRFDPLHIACTSDAFMRALTCFSRPTSQPSRTYGRHA